MQKWNFETKEYEDYTTPSEWKVSCYESDFNTIINCAICGTTITFGSCYTSKSVHTNMGMGYGVCTKCYDDELIQSRLYYNK